MERREPSRASRQVGVVWIAEPVVIGVALARRPGDERRVAVRVAEPAGHVGAHVDPGIAGGDPARQRVADPAGATEPVERQPGRDPEAADPGKRSDERIRVWRHRVRVADEPHDFGVRDEWEAPYCAGHEWREPVEIGRQRPGGVIPGDAVLPARHWVELVPPEDHAAVLGLPIDQVVGVPEARHIPRQLAVGDGLQCDVLMIHRRRRDEPTDHRRDLWSPHPGSIHDELGVDRTRIRQDAADLSPGGQLEPGHSDALADADAEGSGGVGKGVRRAMRIEVAIVSEVHRPEHRLAGHRGHQRQRLPRPDDVRVETDPACAARRSLQFPELIHRRGQPQAADPLEDTESLVERDAVASEPHHRRRRVEGSDQSGGLAGGPGGELMLLDEHHVRPSGRREVVRDAASGDAAADHDHASLIVAHRRYGTSCPAPPCDIHA